MKIASISLLQSLVAVSMLGVTALGAAQAAAIVSTNDGSVTIDAARLTSVISLDFPWRFASTDDPRYSDPEFDDSKLPLIRPGVNKLLTDAHISNVVGGRYWARLHLHIGNISGPLSITIPSVRNSTPYAVFANGKQVGATKGIGTWASYANQHVGIALPAATDIVLAIRFVDTDKSLIHYFSLEQIEIGPDATIDLMAELERYREFEETAAIPTFMGILCFAGTIISLAMLLGQRNHLEYLWLACYFFTAAIDNLGLPATMGGIIPGGPVFSLFFAITDSLNTIAFLEFVATLSAVRHKQTIRIVQGLIVLPPLASVLLHIDMFRISFLFDIVFFGLVFFILLTAYRRGRTECGLLLFSVALSTLLDIAANAKIASFGWFGDESVWHIRGVGFTLYKLSSLQLIIGILVVVLYRFLRVSKDEEIAAAELEAARTVQELLIPAQQPQTPGFHVESVYLPARQVGGDFFILLPSAADSEDAGLLAVMGDVSGKGLQAAMVVSTIIGALRVLASRRPGELLAQLNSVLAEHISGFVTCCVVLIQPDGRMTMANAGNPAPYSGGKEIPTLPGIPLGMIEGTTYEESEHTLDAGAQLTLVSDGVIEATSAAGKTLFGFERTKQISSQSAASIAEAACRFGAGAQQADDITVLTIRLD